MEDKTLTYRVMEALANAIEKSAEANADYMYATAELGNAYAAVLTAEAKENASSIGAKLLEEVKDL